MKISSKYLGLKEIEYIINMLAEKTNVLVYGTNKKLLSRFVKSVITELEKTTKKVLYVHPEHLSTPQKLLIEIGNYLRKYGIYADIPPPDLDANQLIFNIFLAFKTTVDVIIIEEISTFIVTLTQFPPYDKNGIIPLLHDIKSFSEKSDLPLLATDSALDYMNKFFLDKTSPLNMLFQLEIEFKSDF